MTSVGGTMSDPAEERVTSDTSAPLLHVRHAAKTLAVTAGIHGLALLTGILVARTLGVEGRGELAAVLLWPGLIAYLGDLGMPLAYAYQSARDRRQMPALIGNALVASLVQWVLLSLLGSAVILVVLRSHESAVVVTAIVFLVAYLPPNLLARYLNSLNQGVRAFGRFNLVRLSVPLSYATALVLITIFGRGSLQWVVAATLFGNYVALTLVIVMTWRRIIPEFGRPRVDLHVLRRTFGYGVRAHLGNLTPIDSMQIDLLLVTAVLSATDAGLYSVAASAAMLLRSQGTAIGMVMLPTVAAAQTPADRRAAIGSIFRFLLLLQVPTAIVIIAAAGLLVPAIYGPAFAAATPIMRILAVGMVLASMRQVLGDCLRGAGKPVPATTAEAAGWVAGIAALAVLLPLYGLPGAAIGVSISYLTAFVIVLWAVHKLSVPMSDLFVPRPSDLRQWSNLVTSLRIPIHLHPYLEPVIALIRRSTPIVLSIALAITAGAAIGLVNIDITAILLAVLSFILIAPLIVRVARHQFQIFEPLTIICIAMFMMYVARPIGLLLAGQMTYIGYELSPFIDPAITLALIGTLALIVGYFLPIGRRLGSKATSMTPLGLHIDTMIVYAFALFILGIFLYSIFIIQSGGIAVISSFLAGRHPEQHWWYLSSTAYLYKALLFSVPASLLLLACGLTRRRPVLIALSVGMMIPLTLLGGATGGRLNLMMLLAPPVVYAFLHTRRRPPTWLVLVGLYVILMVGVGFLADQRHAPTRAESRTDLLLQAVTRPGEQLQQLIIGPDLGMFDTMALELSVVPDSLSFQHGATVTDILVRFIPRPLWPDKPTESHDLLIQTLWPAHYAVSRASASSSIVGTLYEDSGFFTVIVGMLIFGVAARTLWEWYTGFPTDTAAQMMFSSALPLIVVLARGNLVSTLGIAMFTLFPLVVGIFIARVTHARSQVSLSTHTVKAVQGASS